MRKVIYLSVAVGAVLVGSMFIPAGPLGPQQALAGPLPVPEPSSLILLGTGVIGLARYLRKR